jgi:hypothetical protein
MDEEIVESEAIDCDGDGIASADAPATDCDDERDDVNPDQRDAIGDELDANCDGFEHCYVDADGDGYRTTAVIESIDADCQDDGEATVDEPLVDCDDTTAGVYPGAEEVLDDGVDQDCDGTDAKADAVASEDTAKPDSEDDDPVPVEVTVELDAPAAEKGGCSTVGSTTPARLSWFLGLGLILGFRRRD